MDSGPVRLRTYQPADFETLYRIDQACFPKGIAYGRVEMKAYLSSEDSRCLIAEISNEIAGFILTEQSAEIGHIVTLDVLEPYRRRKIASLLLDATERKILSQGGKLMVLETATNNKAAIALWKKHGYRQLGTITNYYGRGLDALRMNKVLVARGDA